MVTLTAKLIAYIDELRETYVQKLFTDITQDEEAPHDATVTAMAIDDLLIDIRKKIIESVPYELLIYRMIFNDAQDTFLNTDGEYEFTIEDFPSYIRTRYEAYKIDLSKM